MSSTNLILPKPSFGTPLANNQYSKGLVVASPFKPGRQLIGYSHGNNHGTITGAVWSSDGLVFGGGTGNHVVFPDKKLLTTNGSIVIRTMVINYGGNDTLLQESESGFITWDVNASAFRIRIFDTAFTTFSSVNTDFEWHTYVLTWDTAHTAIYKDGILLEIDNTFTGLNASAKSYVLGSTLALIDSYRGTISDYLHYDRALTISEIKALYINLNLPYQKFNLAFFGAFSGAAPPTGAVGRLVNGGLIDTSLANRSLVA